MQLKEILAVPACSLNCVSFEGKLQTMGKVHTEVYGCHVQSFQVFTQISKWRQYTLFELVTLRRRQAVLGYFINFFRPEIILSIGIELGTGRYVKIYRRRRYFSFLLSFPSCYYLVPSPIHVPFTDTATLNENV